MINDFIWNIDIYADDTTLYSKCDQASDFWQRLSWPLNSNLTWGTLNFYNLTIRTTLVLVMEKWMVLSLMKNFILKVQSCKLYNNIYMIGSTQVTNTEIYAFIAVLVFKLLSRKVLFRNRRDNRNC